MMKVVGRKIALILCRPSLFLLFTLVLRALHRFVTFLTSLKQETSITDIYKSVGKSIYCCQALLSNIPIHTILHSIFPHLVFSFISGKTSYGEPEKTERDLEIPYENMTADSQDCEETEEYETLKHKGK
jgi:hypothetical protein